MRELVSPESVAIIAAALALVVATFQALLAAGLPFGEAAWGGTYRVLPTRLRVASGISGLIWVGIAVLLLERGQVLRLGLNPSLANAALWVVTALAGISIVMNLISRSKKERAIWAPVAALLFAGCVFLLFAA